MKKRYLWTLTAGLLLSAALPSTLAADGKEMVMWYDEPGERWASPLPIGNGLVGGLVYGQVQDERIALNESSFWSGRPHDYDDPGAGAYFGPIRDLVFARRFKEAEQMIDEHFYGKPAGQQAYMPLGDLRLFFYDIDTFETKQYYRDLDMENGITKVSYVYDGVTYTREAFVSYPDKVMVLRITADKPGSISFDAWLDSHFMESTSAVPGEFTMDGCWEGPLPKYWLIAPVEGRGMSFRTVLKATNEGGESTVRKNKLAIRGADAVTLVLSAATSHVDYRNIDGDPVAKCANVMNGVAGKDFATLRRRHTDDFSELMGRVHLTVEGPSSDDMPTDDRIQAVRDGATDVGLDNLCFQFGRYMLVSSSREGGQPANLQAIWNERLAPPWGSKYTININTQMNYWPAGVTNLGECHSPLFSMIKDISETGAKTARVYYDGKGWVTHHNLDLWRGTAPVDAARYGIWPVGGAWLCQHIWEHYEFTGDREFLREWYPVLKGAAEFLVNLLTEYPGTNYLVTPFSMSPEHAYYFDDSDVMAWVSPGPTMDIAIMRELFPHCIEASRMFGVDAPFRRQLERALAKLPPYRVNHLGYIQEWMEDWKPQRGGHDVSPYFPFYPGHSILLRRESDGELVAAYDRWLESRGARGTGFPGAWNICMWARLERGDKVAELMKVAVPANGANFLRQGTGSQVDGPFGLTAAIAEALIQSHAGEISLLPALPATWTGTGEITGLCARGGYVVDMKWADGRLVQATITKPGGGECNVRYNGRVVKVSVPADGPAIING